MLARAVAGAVDEEDRGTDALGVAERRGVGEESAEFLFGRGQCSNSGIGTRGVGFAPTESSESSVDRLRAVACRPARSGES